MTKFPDAFTREMDLLFRQFGRQAESADFFAALQQEPVGGLRANTLKITAPALQGYLAAASGLSPAELPPVPWSDDGFYYPGCLQPGKLPAYAAGLYYIQEPSAMLPAQVLAARPGDRVLDLCAAPGGKTARIAADLRGQGLLWANEISAERVRALLRNVELTGCGNALITQETPDRLAAVLPAYFDRILVDAPCSGSGMFRRDATAVKSWQTYGSESCAVLQRSILQAAWLMLRPGGRLAYATCSFSLAENEAMILWFCRDHPDCRILPIAGINGISGGLPLIPELAGTARIWPHLSLGEGHFCALLEKQPGLATDLPLYQAERGPADAWQAFDLFCRQSLSEAGQTKMNRLGASGLCRYEQGHLHVLPSCPAGLAQLKKVKTGLFLGQTRQLKHNGFVFEPSAAFALSLAAEDILCLSGGEGDSDLIRRYLRGETIQDPASDSAGCRPAWPSGAYAAVALQEGGQKWPLGWARVLSPPVLKNLYPPGWRRPG